MAQVLSPLSCFQEKGPKKSTENPSENSRGTLFGESPLGFLQEPFLDTRARAACHFGHFQFQAHFASVAGQRGHSLGSLKLSDLKNSYFAKANYQERKISPKRKFRPDIPADIPPKTSVRRSKSWKIKHFGTVIPCGRPRKNFGLKNFGLNFRSLN